MRSNLRRRNNTTSAWGTNAQQLKTPSDPKVRERGGGENALKEA